MPAIVLNGTDVIKVSNLKRKRKKIEANPLMTILEECEDSEFEERFAYWKSQYLKEEKEPILEAGNYPKILYYIVDGDKVVSSLKNLDGKHTVVCIYDNPKYNVEYEIGSNK